MSAKAKPAIQKPVIHPKKVRYVYYFGDGKADGRWQDETASGRERREPARNDSDRSPGSSRDSRSAQRFAPISTRTSRRYPSELNEQVESALAKVEKSAGKKLGDRSNPLLLSVRSGARDSMPGMMDTILNLGMNDEVVEIVAEKSGNPRFAWDSYRRFLQMYGDVVMGVQKREDEDHDPFEVVIESVKARGRRRRRHRFNGG